MPLATLVFGPAYVDRVVRVAAPLHDPGSVPLDFSVEARSRLESDPSFQLTLRDTHGSSLRFITPADWPGPWGTILIEPPLASSGTPLVRETEIENWSEDLGGMGAGYAAALGGELVSALGDESDSISQLISSLLHQAGVNHQPIRVPDRSADWTLLLSSGHHGDKLPVGFRGCHSRLEPATLSRIARSLAQTTELVVVAGLPNQLAHSALEPRPGRLRLFAPAVRNVIDRETPLTSLVSLFDVIACNSNEWQRLPSEARAQIDESVALRITTEGENGARLYARFQGRHYELHEPAFPRTSPPLDTNRAGETFASTLVATILASGWQPGPLDPDLGREALTRASAAAALQLDYPRFSFPSPAEIAETLSAGQVVTSPGEPAGGFR